VLLLKKLTVIKNNHVKIFHTPTLHVTRLHNAPNNTVFIDCLNCSKLMPVCLRTRLAWEKSHYNDELEIWAKIQRESARPRKSEWGEISGG